MPNHLSHLDETGRARMIDVGAKEATDRRAVPKAIGQSWPVVEPTLSHAAPSPARG